MSEQISAVILIEDVGSLSAHENAKDLASKTGFKVYEAKPRQGKKAFTGEQWQLVFSQQGLVLRLSTMPEWGDIQVDFLSAALSYRAKHGGGKSEAIVKAIGGHKNKGLNVLDCTAGMATDSFVMASSGANVSMLERNIIVAALIEDALQRAQDLDVSSRLRFFNVDAKTFLNTKDYQSDKFDVIYLDPMFPHKKKSALVKKEMQAFQRLLGPDTDSDEIFELALNRALKRVVVKRPNYAPPLSSNDKRFPDLAVKSKKHRFDVYLARS